MLRSCTSTCLWLATAGRAAWALLSEPGGSSRSTPPSLTHNSQRRGALHRGRLWLRFCPPSSPLLLPPTVFDADQLFGPMASALPVFTAIWAGLGSALLRFESKFAHNAYVCLCHRPLAAEFSSAQAIFCSMAQRWIPNSACPSACPSAGDSDSSS